MDISIFDADYPGLYQAADAESTRAQTCYFRCLYWFLLLLTFGAIANLFVASNLSALVATSLFLAALLFSALLAWKRYDRTWFSARAVAESVKTLTWRYMMCAEPYQAALSNIEVRKLFLSDLQEILKENQEITKELCDESASQDPISPTMDTVRGLTASDRLSFYIKKRILEQGGWYSRKAKTNKKDGAKWFFGIVILNGLAILCSIFRIAFLNWSYLPTDVFAVAAASAVCWLQAKRFTELSTSYALTSHEITIIRGRVPTVASEDELSQFVSDTENAFSREHTQWAARRDARCRTIR
jgi:hypothetical protein